MLFYFSLFFSYKKAHFKNFMLNLIFTYCGFDAILFVVLCFSALSRKLYILKQIGEVTGEVLKIHDINTFVSPEARVANPIEFLSCDIYSSDYSNQWASK